MLAVVEMAVKVVAGLSIPRLRLREGVGDTYVSSTSDKADEAAEESEDESSDSPSCFTVLFCDGDSVALKDWTELANDLVIRREGVRTCETWSVIFAVSRAILDVFMVPSPERIGVILLPSH